MLSVTVRKLAAGIFAFAAAQFCFAQFRQPAKPKGPWMDKSLSPDARADLVIKEMSLDEKIQLVHGAGMHGFGAPTDPSLLRSDGGAGFVPGIPRLGLPDLNMADSSVGVGRGARMGRYSTAMPSTLALASSWDTGLAHDYGALIGRELADQGYNVSLGGGVDITREPRNGRNFEYLGEDPILAGNMVAGWIQGVQSQGVIGDIKHYAVNDQETGRYFANAILDKRALRETDLLAFEIGVKKGKPDMVMCSYNLINGDWACENDYTLNQVLKREWGFPGWVISDWFGTHSTVKAANAGLDQEQPSGRYFSGELKNAIESRQVPIARLDDMVHRILRTEFASGIVDNPQPTTVPDVFRGFRVAQRAAEESIVLLKNENRQLPLSAASLTSIAVIGGHADAGVLSGGGSAQVDPAGVNAVPPKNAGNDLRTLFSQVVFHRSSPLAAIRQSAPSAKITYDPGTNPGSAAAAAKSADVAVVFVLQHTHEGGDLESLALPDAQDALVEQVAAANPHTIVVIESGGPVLTPWAGRVAAILEAWYPGIRGGQAIAGVLFGKVNPSARLAVTFPASDSDLPHATIPAPPGKKPGPFDGLQNATPPFPVRYDEGLKVGYKWFDAEKKTPAYPFGFGLSYTTFGYSKLQVTGGSSLKLSFAVQNTGKRAGEEVAQVYLGFPASADEPPKRLVGWQKIALKPGESRTVSLTVDPLYLSVFDPAANRWKILPGEYRVMAGPSSAALPLSSNVRLDGGALPALAESRQQNVFKDVPDQPGLPRVLLIGDSISMGYTQPVRELLAGKANVHRIPENGGPTSRGIEKLDQWLGTGHWDVIHFNFGLHDLRIMDTGTYQVSLADYEANLRRIVARLKDTGARLIWAATTPVPDAKLSPPRHPADVSLFNRAALKIMQENGVAIDDLFALAEPQLAAIQRPANVHYTNAGYEVLAKQVAASILNQLGRQ